MKKTIGSLLKRMVCRVRYGVAAVFLLLSFSGFAQQITVTGKVTSASGEPVVGVSVKVKGSTAGTATDASGNFTIGAPSNGTLEFSSVGFESQEIKIAGETTLNVKLRESSGRSLDEVVVIGYGTAQKRDLTGSIAKISGKEIADKPNSNPVASLQSKVAGLSVVNSGRVGVEPDIRIRGTVSIGSVKPLYVVDGVFNDNIDYINPNDIESIEVLKDASSLAIFGVRGAAGVIAITTKKAKAGQLAVNFNTTFGVKKLVDKIKLTNAADFKTLFTEQTINEGNTPFDYTGWNGNTDWIDALSQTANYSSTNLSLTASTDKNRFYMNAGYIVDEGIAIHERLEKILFSVNDEFRVSKAFKLGFEFNGIRQKLPYDQSFYTAEFGNPLSDARRITPIAEPYNSQYGLYTVLPSFQKQILNPLLAVENNWNKIKHYEYRMVGNVFAEVSFLKYFTAKATLYADLTSGDRTRYYPKVWTYDQALLPGDPVVVDPTYNLTKLNVDNYQRRKFQQDYILTFKKDFGDHAITAIGGFTTYYTSEFHLNGSVNQKASGDSIPDDKRFWYVNTLLGDDQTRKSTSDQWERSTVSGLVRVLYNYKSKYFLNASFRRDASSVINDDYKKKWQSFYAVGAAWEITKEDFMSHQKLFDYFKLKGSWGVLGNQNTYTYNYPFYPGLVGNINAVFGNNLFPAYSQEYIPDPNLHWETVTASEGGFEFNALSNRLHFEATYYSKLTKDLLSFIPGLAGQKPGLSNIGSISNKGFEFTAGWSQNISKDLSVNINANLTTIKNKVVSLFTNAKEGITGADEQYPNRTAVGYPIGFFYGFIQEGVYQNQAEVDASPVVNGFGDYGPGDLKFKDISGPNGKPDGVIDANDRTMIGNPTPDFTYGASVSFDYKGFDLGIDVGGVSGNEIYRYWGTSELTFAQFNYPQWKMGRWHGEGTSNFVPQVNNTHNINSKGLSTFGIENGSYFRIRNLQLGYNFPREMLSKARIKGLRLFVNAQNLKTWKHNYGYTPEFGGTATSFGIDNGDGPVPAVYSGGINVTF